MKLDGIREKVFLDRYALKDKTGSLLEHTPEEMWTRVAKGIATSERKTKRALWEERFYGVMKDFKFVPGGRILSGAGTGYQVTYFNCFVIPSPKDSREGILESLKQLVEIQSRSGGVGLNLSSLRPRGARVKKVNGTSSGPVTWAGLFSYATHDVVQQGGTRRGATMLMLWDWHPDVEEFITVKQDLAKINGANLSVCISDAFMDAVKKDGDWDLVYPDIDDPKYDPKWNGEIDVWKKLGGKVKVHKTIKARDLWNLICEAAWRSAEPGLHFLERSNKQSSTHYFERLIATNPCLPSDTWIHTQKGPRQIRNLIGILFIARVDGADFASSSEGFFKTATKQLFRLETKEGYSLRLTSDHKVQKITKLTRYSIATSWSQAGKLRPGDKVVLHDHRGNTEWAGEYSYDDGYLMGLLIGDGTLKSDKAVLSVWSSIAAESQGVMVQAFQSASRMPHRSDFIGWQSIPQRREYRLSLSSIKRLALELGMEPGKKVITETMEQASSEFYQGLLRGVFDTDGSVQGTQHKGVSVRLAQSDLSILEAVQRMLLRLGIAACIYKNRRVAGFSLLPDGKGKKKRYAIKPQHELVISNENLVYFAERIGFADTQKAGRLSHLLAVYKRTLNKERFIVHVASIKADGVEDVYDAQVPAIHAFDANGFYAHNCGEQPLGAWAVCNLGAMNLSAYVQNEKFDYENFSNDVKVAIRFLDNVIDQTYYFFKENEKCAKDIRRTGLGIMGLGDTLIKMKVRYGSEESLGVLEKIFATLRDSAYGASSDIAKEKGAFPKFDKKKYLQGYHIKALPKSLRDKIAKQGIRNAVLLTIAPTGTTSTVTGVSSGIEPVYEFTFKRKWRGGEDIVYHPLYHEWLKDYPNETEKPDYFVSANDLTPLDHARVQAVAQKYIDSSISKTVNAPNSHTVEEVKTLYMAAYDLGLKGVTYMRDGSRQGVLERVDPTAASGQGEKKQESASIPLPIFPVVPRPAMVEGVTYQTHTPVGEAFITINHNENQEPFEVFITIGKSGSDVAAMAEALGRMISLNLRLAGHLSPRERIRQVVAQLSGIGGTRSIGFGENKVRSLPDAIAKIMAKHYAFRVNGQVEDKPQLFALNGSAKQKEQDDSVLQKEVILQQLPLAGTSPATAGSSTHMFDLCPECGAGSLAYEEGCQKCYSCGYSAC